MGMITHLQIFSILYLFTFFHHPTEYQRVHGRSIEFVVEFHHADVGKQNAEDEQRKFLDVWTVLKISQKSDFNPLRRKTVVPQKSMSGLSQAKRSRSMSGLSQTKRIRGHYALRTLFKDPREDRVLHKGAWVMALLDTLPGFKAMKLRFLSLCLANLGYKGKVFVTDTKDWWLFDSFLWVQGPLGEQFHSIMIHKNFRGWLVTFEFCDSCV